MEAIDKSLTISRTRMWLAVAAATLAMSVSYIDRQALAALAPTVKEALGITHTQYGWLSASFSMAYLIGALLAGAAIDRVGARRGLAWAVLLWSGVAALHAVVPSFAMLFVLRVALGAAEAPSFPGATQTVKRVLPLRHRGTGFGLLFTGSSIGAMIAAPLAVAIHARFGWRVAFVGVALIGLAWIPFWLLVTRGALVRRLGPFGDEDDASASRGGAGDDGRASPSTTPSGTEVSPVEVGGDGGAVASGTGASPVGAGGDGLLGMLRRGEVQRGVLLVLLSAPGLMLVLLWFPRCCRRVRRRAERRRQYAWFRRSFDAGAVGFSSPRRASEGRRRP